MTDALTLEELSHKASIGPMYRYCSELLKKTLAQGDASPESKVIGLIPMIEKDFAKPLHELACKELGKAYQTLVLKSYEDQLKKQQAGYRGYSEEDLAAERSTKVLLKAKKDFETYYWLAVVNKRQSQINFIKTLEAYPLILESINVVVTKIAEEGDQENLDKLLALASTSEERVSLVNSGIDGACKGGQINILRDLFEDQASDKKSGQEYLSNNEPSLFRDACASGNLDTVEFILQYIPEARHKQVIGDVYEGYRYSALKEACGSGNSQVVDRLLKPFSSQEIDDIFSPTHEETKGLPLPLSYSSILSYDSIEINQHILTKLVSAECRGKIVESEPYVKALVQTYDFQDERFTALLKLVPAQQFDIVQQAVIEKIKDWEQDFIEKFRNDSSRVFVKEEKEKQEQQPCQKQALKSAEVNESFNSLEISGNVSEPTSSKIAPSGFFSGGKSMSPKTSGLKLADRGGKSMSPKTSGLEQKQEIGTKEEKTIKPNKMSI
ncbi:MAG: hypothetical protein WAL30_05615 [Candidatus Aquirickettsiella sp.]